MLHDWCYAIDVYDESRNRASFEEIEIRLCQVVRDVEKREAEGERAVPIGVLSADGRDRWAKVFQSTHLIATVTDNF